ncbi:L-fucose:H+ symporter permease [Algibacillus agarilyticus]|uniref:L-fucose:H+ symporter permease n=1 Tax=Algibacillus agarilyticus TaxID=2234133 RepID=UPI000DCFC35E|nr:L-fucose:H+ symporter permease [Algibacillus agarilyticus]
MATQFVDNMANQKTGSSDSAAQNFRLPLIILTSLFFVWGFLTSLNDILIPHLKSVFSLNYTQAMLVQFCFFGAYFIVSIPAGKWVKKMGYQKGIVTGLFIAGLGCFAFYPAAAVPSYPVFLSALFVLAAGITILQVSANPYVAALGKVETASGRLTMTQAFNSLGTTVAPMFGALLILGATASGLSELNEAEQKLHEAQSVQLPYIGIAICLMLLAGIFSFLKLPSIDNHQVTAQSTIQKVPLLSHRALTLGAIGIFVYVGAEVSIGSFLINFFGEADIAGLSEAEAASYLTYFWGGAMVGRFIGALLMQRIKASSILSFNALAAALLVLLAILSQGYIALYAVLLVGLFNSIMFPTIFSLALTGLKERTSEGSGLLCLAIVGGAIVPLMQGVLADALGIQLSFILPGLCYLYIFYYGYKGYQQRLN